MAEELPAARARARDLIPAEALARVPGYEASCDIAVLDGGTLNRSFRVATAVGKFVLRLNDPAAQALGANHAREAHLQNAAAQAGVAPRVFYLDPAQRFMVSQYIEGRVWSSGDFSDPAQLRKVGAVFRRLQAIEPGLDAPFDLAALLQRFAERIARSVAGERRLVAQLMERAARSLAACASGTRPRTLFHSDPHHDNIIEAEGGLVLVDWEYAAVGDPLYDLACVLSLYPQAEPHAGELLESSGLAGLASAAMLRHASWLYLLLNYFWYRARRIEAAANGEDLAAESALLVRLQ